MRFNELRETRHLRLSGEFKRFADEELRAALTLLAGPGVVWELAFGSWVLLQPERIVAYAPGSAPALPSQCGGRAELPLRPFFPSRGRREGSNDEFVALGGKFGRRSRDCLKSL